jgi:hypothetical protein
LKIYEGVHREEGGGVEMVDVKIISRFNTDISGGESSASWFGCL